jgi:glycosyltransferase involved in cell wall biosynthesis
MASSLPIVATDVSGTRQVMVPGETGFMVKPGDSLDLSRAITDLITDIPKAEAMGMRARQRVENLFSAQKQAREYLSLFQENRERTNLHLVSYGEDNL